MTGDERWTGLDDTLADGPAPVDVPDESRQWLAEQRTMHGLLRAMNTADSASTEGRITAILERIDAQPVASTRRHWSMVLAAALVLASIGVWFALPPGLPTADAAIARAADQLAQQVDRRFHIQLTTTERRRPRFVRHEFELTARPGQRFLLDGSFTFGGARLMQARIGSDGETFWVQPANRARRTSGPLADRERLLEQLGYVLDIGYMDVHALLNKLPGNVRLRVAERFVDDDGSPQLVLKSRGRARIGPFRLRSAELIVDEASGMIMRLEALVLAVGGGPRRLVVEYLGEAEPGSVDYSRPW